MPQALAPFFLAAFPTIGATGAALLGTVASISISRGLQFVRFPQ